MKVVSYQINPSSQSRTMILSNTVSCVETEFIAHINWTGADFWLINVDNEVSIWDVQRNLVDATGKATLLPLEEKLFTGCLSFQ